MYAGGFKQVLDKEYICWIQVKIHISDQTSLRICNSVCRAGTTTLCYIRLFPLVNQGLIIWRIENEVFNIMLSFS
jgi:hypothetical protein